MKGRALNGADPERDNGKQVIQDKVKLSYDEDTGTHCSNIVYTVISICNEMFQQNYI